MVLLLLVPIRSVYRLQDVITERHLGTLGAVMLTTGLLMGYVYVLEPLLAVHAGHAAEMLTVLRDRPFGPHAWAYWSMLACNVAAPQLLWSRRIRRDPRWLLVVSAAVVSGMWLERFVLVVTTLERKRLPGGYGVYHPTAVDIATLGTSLCLFAFLYLVFLRLLPAVPLSEVKDLAVRGETGPEAA
ncbi:MAG: molybdopterin oxidoreductase [Myxococcota bacterium]